MYTYIWRMLRRLGLDIDDRPGPVRSIYVHSVHHSEHLDPGHK